MAGNALRKRENWQTASGCSGLAGSAEKKLLCIKQKNAI